MATSERPMIRFLITCADVEECTVFFEPEGAHHTLRAGEHFTVDITPGDLPPYIEVMYEPEGLAIVEGSNGTVRVRNQAGVELPI